MDNLFEIANALKAYYSSTKELQRLGILKNKKDFTCQLGEWLVCELYGGKLAKSPNQKGWDIQIGNNFIQVKAHAKASTNNSRRTRLSLTDTVRIDELITIIFSEDYKILEFYRTPWKEAVNLIAKHKSGYFIYWNNQQQYKINIDELPNQKLVSLFKK